MPLSRKLQKNEVTLCLETQFKKLMSQFDPVKKTFEKDSQGRSLPKTEKLSENAFFLQTQIKNVHTPPNENKRLMKKSGVRLAEELYLKAVN